MILVSRAATSRAPAWLVRRQRSVAVSLDSYTSVVWSASVAVSFPDPYWVSAVSSPSADVSGSPLRLHLTEPPSPFSASTVVLAKMR